MLALIAVVEVLAVVLPATLWTPASVHHLVTAGFLIGLSLSYSQVAFGWERVRRVLLFRRLPSATPSVQTTWTLAAALLLPPVPAAAVTGLCMAGAWRTYNPAGSSRPRYRYVYTSMATVLAATMCSWVFQRAARPHHWISPLAVSGAAVLWMAVTWTATALAIAAAGGLRRAAQCVLDWRGHALVLATVVLATGEYYAANRFTLPALALSVPAAIGVQRLFARAELRAFDAQEVAARLRLREAQEVMDTLMSQASWVYVAEIVVTEYACTLVRVEADPDLGNLAEVVRAVADVQVGNELVGRYGPSGIAILTSVTSASGTLPLRLAAALVSRGVASCRVASVSSPRDGRTVHDLLAVCEAELVLRGGHAAVSDRDRR